MKTSEQINELAAALSKAQGQIVGAKKDSANPFFKSKYADLASCWDACREQLSWNGLAVVQGAEHSQVGGIAVTTLLTHSSGQWVESTLVVHPKDDSPQAAGSAITYARRYALAAIVGLAQVDDDAEAAQGRHTNGHAVKANGDPTPGVSEKQAKETAQQMLDALNADVGDDMKAMRVADLHDAINALGEPLYRAAWKHLDSKQRASWKSLHALASDRERAETTPTW